VIAREVRRYREERGMSAQQLADKTAALGAHIPRSVLANLENGRRPTVSVAEVVVLAAALNVSPLELMSPVGYDEQVEILPGRMTDPRAAARWFSSEVVMDVGSDGVTMRPPGSGEQTALYLLDYHQEMLDQLDVTEAEAERAAADAAAPDADERARGEAAYRRANAEKWREFIRDPLRRTREEMRRRGMIVPPLPEDLKLDDEDGGSR
jgi:transcriptional regulator with XRE-family HTH domain